MPETTLVDCGAVAVILYLVFKFITDFRGRKSSLDMVKLTRDMEEIRSTVEQVNGNGIQVFNARPILEQQTQLLQTLEKAIERLGDRLAAQIERQTIILQQLVKKGTPA